jgi:gliding-associated putative ABC transporter substrate-binding component GldG
MKRNSVIRFFAFVGGIIVLNLILSSYFFRIDLTEDQRYSMTAATISQLQNLKKEVSVIVYLEGDMPAGFKRLRNATEEKLREFEIYAHGKINFHFIDPSSVGYKKAQNKFYSELAAKGILPNNVHYTENEQTIEKLVFPYALVVYEGKELPVLLLKGTKGTSAEEKLNQSAENIEYELATAIRKLTIEKKQTIGFITGHGEPVGKDSVIDLRTADFMKGLSDYYNIAQVELSDFPDTSLQNALDAIILIKPDTAFSEADKYKLDQFIVNGGKALFFMDALKVGEIDNTGTLAVPYDLNLDDLFFRYGFRVNQNLIKDLVSAKLPMVTNHVGNQSQTEMMPYRYLPLINGFANHPITHNTDVIYTKFVSSIDTVKAKGITKIPLLFSSKYSKALGSPVMVSFNDARRDADPKTFTPGNFPVAYLLEGKFRSLYANRITEIDPRFKTFKEYGKTGKIVVVSDGDIVQNSVSKQGRPMDMGYDPYSGQVFGNRDFALHAVDFLLDENGLITARNKQITLRPLDKKKVREEHVQWQVLNLVLPIIITVIFGLVWSFLRKQTYGK